MTTWMPDVMCESDALLTVPSDRPSRALQRLAALAQRARRAGTASPWPPSLNGSAEVQYARRPASRPCAARCASRDLLSSWVGGPPGVQRSLRKPRAGAPRPPARGLQSKRTLHTWRACVRSAHRSPPVPLAGGSGGGPFNITRHYACASQLRANKGAQFA